MKKNTKLTKGNLPIYKMKMKSDTDTSTGVSQISLVLEAATGVKMITFSEGQTKPKPLKLSVTDPDEQICMSAVLVPNIPIYRNDGGNEYILIADEADIFQAFLKYAKLQRHNNVDLEHDGSLVSGVTMLDNFITNEKRGIVAPVAFSDMPYGTWFASYKVDNPDIWASIKEGNYGGFSITGLFDLEETDLSFDSEEVKTQDPLSLFNELNDLLKDY